MRTLILASLLVLAGNFTYAQEKRIEIVCEVINGDIHYGKLTKYLPESQKHHLFTMKKLHKYESIEIVTMLNMQGWKVVSAVRSAGSSQTAYIMKNEIAMSNEEYGQMQARLKKDIK
jgi:hypothetical protein